jgi:microcystin-dependent protein
MEAYLGMVIPVAFGFAPRGYAFCNGQLMPIAQNTALFSLLGTTYGGNGQTTFALPDLRGRTIVGSQGTGPGLQNVVLGQMGGMNAATIVATGSVAMTLTTANMPAHTHPATFTSSSLSLTTTVQASTNAAGAVTTPAAGSFLGTSPAGGPTSAAIYAPAGTVTGPVNLGGVTSVINGTAGVTVGSTGSGQPVLAPVQTTAQIELMPPYTGINYVICIEGLFPTRN